MFFRSPPPPNSRFSQALAAGLARRPALVKEAADRVLNHYRRTRRLPPRPVPALLPRTTLAWLIVRGEAEHRLGLVRARRLLAHWLGQTRGDGRA